MCKYVGIESDAHAQGRLLKMYWDMFTCWCTSYCSRYLGIFSQRTFVALMRGKILRDYDFIVKLNVAW